MYDELIKRLRDAAKMSEALAVLLPHSEGNATAKLYKEAADVIEELTRENESLAKSVNEASEILHRRWISVTERLPETPGEYMVAYHPCYWDRVHDEIKVGLDSFRGKTSWAKKKYQRVTHWMPLPEPPKEE